MGGHLSPGRSPVTLAEHEAAARARLEPATWAYFDGGAADGLTQRANRAAWDGIALLPRVLRGMHGAHTRVELLGRTLAHPMLVAPMAYQRLAHADGEVASAVAASAQGAGFVLSAQATVRLETVARAVVGDADRGPLWFQLTLQGDGGLARDLAQRAHAAGYEAIVLTVDAPVSGVRDAERRAGFRLPPGVSAVNLPPATATQDGILANLPEAPDWDAAEAFIAGCPLPVLLKGILHPADAREAVRRGAAGVIVSNHGGRTLDTLPATAWALPAVADAVAGAVPVLVDGGIRRGTDVLKALALGARAVLVGRPVLWGLASGGPAGVAHVLKLLKDEFEIALALTGCRSPAEITSEILLQPAPGLLGQLSKG